MFQKNLLLCFSMLIAFTGFGQIEEIDPYGRDLDSMTLIKRGPNQDKYSHLFLSYGFVGGFDADSSEVIFGKSGSFSIGYLWKWRLSKSAEIGFDIAYHRTAYHIVQDSTKTIPSNQLHKKEKLVFNSIMTAPFVRIKLVNKIHSNGTFIDFGGFAGWQYDVRHKTLALTPNSGAGKTKTLDTDLDYKRDYTYGLLTRVGFNRFVFYGRYRLSNVFTDKSGFNDLPVYEIGMRLGIHQ